MGKRAIWTILIIMSISLIGVSVIQVFWIKWSLDLNEQKFNDGIVLAMNRVKAKLLQDVEAEMSFLELSTINKNSAVVTEVSKKDNKISPKVNKNIKDVDSDEFLENIDNKKLDQYLREELKHEGINLDYDYGVFSNKSENFVIHNGNYVAQIGDVSQASNAKINTGLLFTEYRIPIFDSYNREYPGYLIIYFPKKAGFLWKTVWPFLLMSTLFTSLILFCFLYTFYIIFKQKKLSEIKNDFINNMTHEFKTPIATISLSADSLANPNVMGNETRTMKFINIIKEENKRMLAQVEKVLQMAQIDKQEIQLKVSEINVNELVQRAANHAELKLLEREGCITVSLMANDSIIQADQNHIANMISNLLDNAEKYTKTNPNIQIETKNIKGGIQISVTDNGVGMSKEVLKNIFEKFYRAPTGNVHDVKGFGLGLNYVKAMTEAHGGKITVKSEVGKGSTFTIFLPFEQKNKN